MSKLFEKPTKDKHDNLQFYSPSGEKVRIKYIWNEDRTDLVEHEKIDIVSEMNERAKGTSIEEQIARLERGDTSVIDSSHVTEEDFTCDVSGMPETSVEVIQQANDAKVALMNFKSSEARTAKENAELKALKDDLIAKKAAYDEAVKAFDAQKDKKEGEE